MIHGCELRVSAIDDIEVSWLGRESIEKDIEGRPVWRLVRCSILRARTTDEQRIALKAAGDLIELTELEWMALACHC